MFCRQCGTENPDDSRFCAGCGRATDPAADVSEPPSDDPLIGRVLDRAYRIDAVIGRGGMGVVYRGTNLRLDQPIAIKTLSSHLASDPEVRARFRNEARTQAGLRHPGIVAVTDFVSDAGVSAIVMELAEGTSLEELLDEAGGPLPIRRVRDIALPVLDAIAFAHEQGITHRDVKPSNIMITRAGSREIPKVTDFGIAKVIASDHKLTATGTMMGTLEYMAPEQCVSAKDVDHRADVYAMGATLFEMATGRVPFVSDNPIELVRCHTELVPPNPSFINPEVPGDLADLILKALEKKPADRFQSIEGMADALGATRTLEPPAVASREPEIPPTRELEQPPEAAAVRVEPRDGPAADGPKGPAPSHASPARVGARSIFAVLPTPLDRIAREAWLPVTTLGLVLSVLVGVLAGRACEGDTDSDAAATVTRPAARRAVPPVPSAEPPRGLDFDDSNAVRPSPERVSARHLLVHYRGSMRAGPGITRSRDAARRRAEEAMRRARGGEDFADVAREYSDEPSGPRGGDLGTFSRGQMHPAFEQAAFELSVGEVSDVVETPFGYHVVYRYR